MRSLSRSHQVPVVALTLMLAGCPVLDADAPAGAYRSFASAMAHGDSKTAWDLLSHETQQELTRQAGVVAKARGLPPPADGRQVAFMDSFFIHREIKTTTIATRSGDRATVLVSDDKGGQQTISTVRERKGWRVDLTAEIRQAAQG